VLQLIDAMQKKSSMAFLIFNRCPEVGFIDISEWVKMILPWGTSLSFAVSHPGGTVPLAPYTVTA